MGKYLLRENPDWSVYYGLMWCLRTYPNGEHAESPGTRAGSQYRSEVRQPRQCYDDTSGKKITTRMCLKGMRAWASDEHPAKNYMSGHTSRHKQDEYLTVHSLKNCVHAGRIYRLIFILYFLRFNITFNKASFLQHMHSIRCIVTFFCRGIWTGNQSRGRLLSPHHQV